MLAGYRDLPMTYRCLDRQASGRLSGSGSTRQAPSRSPMDRGERRTSPLRVSGQGLDIDAGQTRNRNSGRARKPAQQRRRVSQSVFAAVPAEPCPGASHSPARKAPPNQRQLLDLVGARGLEPPTPTMSRWCSNQLSYAPAATTTDDDAYRVGARTIPGSGGGRKSRQSRWRLGDNAGFAGSATRRWSDG